MKTAEVRAHFGEIILAILLSLVALPSALSEDRPSDLDARRFLMRDRMALARLQSPPLGLPIVPVPDNNPVTIAKIALGRKLFFDRRLSLNGTMSCGMCHIPEQGFTNNELSTPIGVHGQSLRRNAPTILNSAYAPHLFQDGREVSLERQAVLPFLAHDEMGIPNSNWLVAHVAGLADYNGLFERAFSGGPSMKRIGEAIASWERTLLAAGSQFDRWRYGGELDALTSEQKRGFALFIGKGRCAQCHLIGEKYALFTDHEFHNTGIGYRHDVVERETPRSVFVEIEPQVFVLLERDVIEKVGRVRPADLGRFEVTHVPQDRWRFRTPTLRNVALTAPYMHDGSLPTLESVVRFYNHGGVSHEGLDPLIVPLELDDYEIKSITAFLGGLTADNLPALEADARTAAIGN